MGLSQTVVNVEGGDYILTFDALIEEGFTAETLTVFFTSSDGQIASIELKDQKIGLLEGYTGDGYTSPALPDSGYQYQRALLLTDISPSASITVEVLMQGGVFGPTEPQSALFDNFVLTRVPEPAGTVLVGAAVFAARHGAQRRKPPASRNGVPHS